MGSANTIHVTLSYRGGVVSEPKYVQYTRVSGNEQKTSTVNRVRSVSTPAYLESSLSVSRSRHRC